MNMAKKAQKCNFLARTPTKYFKIYIFRTGSSRRFRKGKTLEWYFFLSWDPFRHHVKRRERDRKGGKEREKRKTEKKKQKREEQRKKREQEERGKREQEKEKRKKINMSQRCTQDIIGRNA